MMTKKSKLSDVAKDLQIETAELIAFYAQRNPQQQKKKAASGLTSEEVNAALEHYTQQQQVDSFDAYFATRSLPHSAFEKQKEATEKKPEKKSMKKTERTEKKTNQNHQKPAEAAAPAKATAAPEKKREGASAAAQKQGQKSDHAAQKKQPQQQSQQQAQKKPQKNNGGEQKKPQKHGERLHVEVELSSGGSSTVEKRRTVDTRGSYVDLDKYNQRYEQIAPAGKYSKDNYSTKKQKINQKSAQRNKQKYSNKRETEQDKLRRLELERARKQQLKVMIPDTIVVSELASRLKVTATEVIKKLMGLGVMATINEEIDFDTASLVAEELGAKVEKEVIVTIEERLIDDSADKEEDLEPRAPVVVVMGHVDHGKTSLLDYIRNTNVASGEAGGITQAIGAYQVQVNGKPITFLDTPGHEAFTAMRARGAMVTDIAILVVAADDGIMPQTVESINHAKAANIPIIVAVNKMDKPHADPERIKQQLTEYELVCEEWGGDTIICPISAKTGMGIEDLLESVSLVAEMGELKANPNRAAKGAVIEARLDKGRGPVATLLVQNGTLHQGDVIIAGTSVGRIRAMTDFKGRKLKDAGPSVPVEIIGMGEVPGAGDEFHAVADEKMARELVEQRKQEQKDKANAPAQKLSLEDLFSQIQQGELKNLNIIVKADVQGSAEAVKASLEKLSNEEVRVRVIHNGVGAINESDVMLAATSNAIIVGFNVRPDANAKSTAERTKVDMRMYRVIYDAIGEIEAAMKGMLAPKFKEVELGRVEVRQVYKITNVGMVAGSYVQSGKITRNAQMRLVRDGIVIHEGTIASLQRFKDSVKEVAAGYECGITLEKFSDIKEGDIFECFEMQEIAR
jgi:translation initiation factor IF-2